LFPFSSITLLYNDVINIFLAKPKFIYDKNKVYHVNEAALEKVEDHKVKEGLREKAESMGT